MGSKARRTALSVAGIALAGGASLALAAPASAATPAGGEFYDTGYTSSQTSAVSGTYTKVETTKLNFQSQTSANAFAVAQSQGCSNGCGDPRCSSTCGSSSCHNNCGDPGCNGGCSSIQSWQTNTKIVGFYRTYREAYAAAVRGGWDNFDCDFTRRGYRGWHQSWNKWGGNDWRCRGTWVLTVAC